MKKMLCAAAMLVVMSAAGRGPEPPVVVVGPPPPLAAPPEPEPEEIEPVEPPRKNGAFELSIGVTTFTAALGDERFRGRGTPRDGTGVVGFSQTGSDLGISTPRLWGPELRVGYVRRYLAVGVSAFAASNGGGADAQPARPEAAAFANPSKLTAFGGALDLYGAVPIGRVTVRLGADVGIRSFNLPLSGFDPKLCTSSGRRGTVTYPCSETAWTKVVPYVHPQLRVDFAVAKVFFSPSIGIDALGRSGVVAGLSIGFRTDAHEDLRP